MRSDDFMNAEDVARYLNLGKNTVYQLAKTGRLASYHVGRKLKFTLEDVEAYVASTRHARPAGVFVSGMRGDGALGSPGAKGAGSGAGVAVGMGAGAAVAGAVSGAIGMGSATGAGGSSGAAVVGSMPAAAAAATGMVVGGMPGAGGAEELSAAASFGALDGDPFYIAGADPVADLLAGSLNAAGVPAGRLVRASYTALVNLYAGDADAAVVHLYDQATNSFNVPYVRNLAPGASVVVFRLYGRAQGLIVQKGNPKRLTTWGSLLREGVRLANRGKGSGSRVLLDEKLRAMEARSEAIEGYEAGVTVGSTAIRRVAGNLADVTVGAERETLGVEGVEFVPLQMEWIDLVARKTARSKPLIRQIKDTLASERFGGEVASLVPCDTSKLGAIVYES